MEETQVIFVNPNTFEYQEYQASDIGLIALSDLDTSFTSSTDYIEYHVYDANKNLIYPQTPPSNFTSYNVKDGDILFDPASNLVEIDLDQGVYFSQYSFYRKRCGSSFENNFFLLRKMPQRHLFKTYHLPHGLGHVDPHCGRATTDSRKATDFIGFAQPPIQLAT